MRKIIFILVFALIGTFAFASSEISSKFENTISEINNEKVIKSNEIKEVSVTYCVSYGGNLYCCEGATYSEARSCARAMAKESIQPQ